MTYKIYKPFWEKLIWNQQRLILSVKENGCCWNKCDEDHHPEKAGGTIHQPTRIGQQSWNCKASLRLSHQHTTFMSVMVRRTMLGDRSRWRGGERKINPCSLCGELIKERCGKPCSSSCSTTTMRTSKGRKKRQKEREGGRSIRRPKTNSQPFPNHS